MSKRYLSCAETAKLVRKALKREFPGAKFSVRSRTYAGGASIDVRWTDGPRWRPVQDVLDTYQGARFDGMIDLQYRAEHLLFSDGTVQVVRTYGHSFASHNTPGSVAEARARIHPDAEQVSLGAHYVHGQRELSEGFRAYLLGMVSEALGEPVTMETGHVPLSAYESSQGSALARDDHRGEYVPTLVHQLGELIDARGLDLDERGSTDAS